MLSDRSLKTVGICEYSWVKHVTSKPQDALKPACMKAIQGLDAVAAGYLGFTTVHPFSDNTP